MMSRFLDCLCDDNLQSLTIDGNPPPEELESAWLKILSEFIEIDSDLEEDMNGVWSLSREITQLEDHLFLVDICIGILSERFTEVFAGNLRRLGYSFRPVSTDPEEYMDLLRSVANKAKSKKVRLSQLNTELKEKLKESGPAPERNVFEAQLLHFEEMQKVSYDMDTITVYKFLMLKKKLKQKQKYLEEKNQKHGRTD